MRHKDTPGPDEDPTSPTTMFGFTGLAQSGKDTACGMLAENYMFDVIGFADPMREMACAIDPIVGRLPSSGALASYNDVVELVGYEMAKRDFPELRSFLQRLGTEAGRGVLGENVWVDAAMRRAADCDRVCFSDVRFLNEAEAIKAAGGKIVRVVRDGAGLQGDHAQHPSEVEMLQIAEDIIIDNNRTITDLRRKVDALMG